MPIEANGPDVLLTALRGAAPEIGQLLEAMSDDSKASFDRLAASLASADEVVGKTRFGAVCNDGPWHLIQVLDADTTLENTEARVAMFVAGGELSTNAWSVIRADAALHLGKQARFVGELWLQWSDSGVMSPLHLDADAWAGSIIADGETDFVLQSNGERFEFDPRVHDLWGGGPPALPVGTWLSVESECTSITVSSDAQGCLWAAAVEWATLFLGRPTTDSPSPANRVFDLLERPEADGDFAISDVTSDFLLPAEMAHMIDALSTRDPNYDPETIDVTCKGFHGTAAELFLLPLAE